MLQQPLPADITRLSPQETDARITIARRSLGKDLIILGHHYQRDEVIQFADDRIQGLEAEVIPEFHRH